MLQVDYFCLLDQDRVWYDIDEMVKQRMVPGGVYRVHAFRQDAPPAWNPEHLQPVSRVLQDDPYGRLYIGKADAFLQRFSTLRKALHPDFSSEKNHGVGRTYKGSIAWQTKFPRLCFTLKFADAPRAAEIDELAGYREKFGEPPPLNSMS